MSKSPEQVVAEALEADHLRPKDGWADWAAPIVAALREAGMLTEPIEVTDAMADAAAIAYHEFTFGPEEPLTKRDLGIVRQANRVAIQAALEARGVPNE